MGRREDGEVGRSGEEGRVGRSGEEGGVGRSGPPCWRACSTRMPLFRYNDYEGLISVVPSSSLHRTVERGRGHYTSSRRGPPYEETRHDDTVPPSFQKFPRRRHSHNFLPPGHHRRATDVDVWHAFDDEEDSDRRCEGRVAGTDEGARDGYAGARHHGSENKRGQGESGGGEILGSAGCTGRWRC